MRFHTTTVLSLSALAVLALTGSSTGNADSSDSSSSTTFSAHPDGQSAPASAPLSSGALAKRLLDENDLGEGYTRKPQRAAQHDDVTVIGCPALEKLGSEAAIGGSLDFPQKVLEDRLGNEQWSQLLTFTARGRSSIVKQTAVRTGTVVVVVSGGPSLGPRAQGGRQGIGGHIHGAMKRDGQAGGDGSSDCRFRRLR
ncbi:hypothetical protein [Streptomyces viridochromogenes]|uniref:Secreted protein n=1 Tax=Streptomyces viridochromogenes Tue57 TaxID=1160705 RepID=L8PII8_STRVR|nr:hypothetical protein [Streptomyces viridochromogenes]ELS55187.1 hypothetical protein STVIR_3888 [Streptomyces viridochromogenes Tue57]